MQRSTAIPCALLLLAAHPLARARAQDSERYPIVIWGEEEAVSFSLRDPAGTTLVERCREPCNLTLPRGKFRLEIFDAEGQDVGRRSVKVDRSAIWTAAPQDTTARDVGLAVGIGGLILLNVGSILFLTSVGVHGGASEAEATRAGIGLLTVLGGAIATPIGWATFFSNLRAHVDVRSLEPSAP